MKSVLGVLFALCGLGAVAMSCSDADELIDCQQICSRYQSCFDNGYDVSACRSRCENKADEDKAFADRVDACEKCIDDRSCTSSVFSCSAQCAGVVP